MSEPYQDTDPMAQHRSMTACPLCGKEDCEEHRVGEPEVNVWVDEPPIKEGELLAQLPLDRWAERKDLA